MRPRFLPAIAITLFSALYFNLTLALADPVVRPEVTAPALLPRQATQDERLIGYYLPSGTLECDAKFFFTTAVFLISSTSSTIGTCLGTEWRTKIKEAGWWVDCSHRVGVNGTSSFVETSPQSNCATGTLLPSLGAPTASPTYYFIPTAGSPSTLFRTAPFAISTSAPNAVGGASSGTSRSVIIGASVGGAIAFLIIIAVAAGCVLKIGMRRQDRKRAKIERESRMLGIGSETAAEVPMVPVVHYYK